jgi:hypothetical protein
MNDPASHLPVGGPLRPSAAGAAGPAKSTRADAGSGASFKALLESLEQRAEALDEKSRGELAPEELAAAVDEARSSMQDVLALQDQLLEAWRQSRHQSAKPRPESGGPGQGAA